MASKYDKCIGQLMKLAVDSKAFTRTEAEALFQKLQNESNKIGKVSADVQLAALREAAGEFAEQSILAAKVNKLRAALTANVEFDFREHMKNFVKDPYEGIKTFLVGAENVVKGGHVSVDAYMKAAKFDIIQRTMGELKEIKSLDGSKSAIDLAYSGALDRGMAWNLAAESDKSIKIPDNLEPHTAPTSRDVAVVLKKMQSYMRNLLNMTGCNIVDLPGRITRQMHNPPEMLKMGFEKWSQLAQKLFHKDTYDGREPKEFLQSMYDAVTSGLRKSYEGDEMGSFKSHASNMADQVSKQRLVKFNDPDAFLAYRSAMKQPGSLFHDILNELSAGAGNAAMFQKMSPDPLGFYNRMTSEVALDNRTDTANKNRIGGRKWLNDARMKNITGFTSVDVNPSTSNIFDGIRTFVAANTQWLSAVKSLPDIAAGVNTLSLWGEGTFDSVAEFANGWANHFGANKGTAFEEGNRNSYYLAEHYFMNINADWRDGNDIKGLSRTVMSSIYKWNQQIRWDSVMKQTVGQAVSRILGNNADKTLAQISSVQFKNNLIKYGIDENTWDTIRQGVYKATNSGEHNYITADATRALPDEAIVSYLSKSGQSVTPYAMERARSVLATKVSLMLNDAGDHTITLAGANERALMNYGTQRGTLPRGMLDLAMQFRGYALANAYRTYSSMIYGRGSESIMEALRNKNGELPHLASNIAIGMVAWYIADTAKNAIQGVGPRTYSSENGGMNRANIQNGLTAIAGSGGLGPYSDMLTTDFGGDAAAPLKFLAGPTGDRLAKGASLAWKSTIDQLGNAEEGETGRFPATQDIKYAQENLPFLSLPPVKLLSNWLILNHLENYMNPGLNAGREKRMLHDTNQTNLGFTPSQQ